MPVAVFLLTYPVRPTRFNGSQAHWGIFVPTNAAHTSIGKVIHVTGTPFTGYGLEFKRNYDLSKTGRFWRQWHLATISDAHVDEDSNSSSSTVTPASVAAASTDPAASASSEPAAADAVAAAGVDENPAPEEATAPAEMPDHAAKESPQLNTGYSIDVTPRDTLEREAKKISPPGPSPEPLNPAAGRRCQSWVREYVNWLILHGIFPESAEDVLAEAKAVEAEPERY